MVWYGMGAHLTLGEGYSGVQRQAASVWAEMSVVFSPQVQEIWVEKKSIHLIKALDML